jgi:hypothetical protein
MGRHVQNKTWNEALFGRRHVIMFNLSEKQVWERSSYVD